VDFVLTTVLKNLKMSITMNCRTGNGKYNDTVRRRTDASVSTMVEVTPLSAMGARRSATEFRTPECFNTVAFGTPRAESDLKRTRGEVAAPHDDVDSESLNSSVTVAVRVRPFGVKELSDTVTISRNYGLISSGLPTTIHSRRSISPLQTIPVSLMCIVLLVSRFSPKYWKAIMLVFWPTGRLRVERVIV